MGGSVLEYRMRDIRNEALAEGKEEGVETEKLSGIKRAIEKLHMTEAEAMDYMDIASESRPRYQMLLREEADGAYDSQQPAD